MAKILFADAASSDEAGILNDLRTKAGLPTAFKFRFLFRDLYDRLATYPESGARRPALGRNIRIGIVAPYIAIYHLSESGDVVRVLRIVHGRRRVTGALLGEN